MFDDLIEGNGGSTNGFTTRDLTAYLNNFPREALPLVLDLESDRMAHLAITQSNLEQERGIVMEERRLRIDDQVSGAMNEELYLAAFMRARTAGTLSASCETSAHHARAGARVLPHLLCPEQRHPGACGDVAPERRSRSRALLRAHPAAHAARAVDASEPPQAGRGAPSCTKRRSCPHPLRLARRRRRDPRPRRPRRARAPARRRRQRAPRADLVRKHEIATERRGDNDLGHRPRAVPALRAGRARKTAAEPARPHRRRCWRDLAAKPVPPDELAKAKNALQADLSGLKTVSGKANQLGFFEVVFGDYRTLFGAGVGVGEVGPEDVRRVGGKYSVPERRPWSTLDARAPRRAEAVTARARLACWRSPAPRGGRGASAPAAHARHARERPPLVVAEHASCRSSSC
jgi:hypothetical protein